LQTQCRALSSSATAFLGFMSGGDREECHALFDRKKKNNKNQQLQMNYADGPGA
jgi:hypothetical protein